MAGAGHQQQRGSRTTASYASCQTGHWICMLLSVSGLTALPAARAEYDVSQCNANATHGRHEPVDYG